jgi:hypothetical protein
MLSAIAAAAATAGPWLPRGLAAAGEEVLHTPWSMPRLHEGGLHLGQRWSNLAKSLLTSNSWATSTACDLVRAHTAW